MLAFSRRKQQRTLPTRTAALLLEAALRIQKQSKTKNNGGSSGLFGSILKRITHRNKSRNSEISNVEGAEVSVKDILRWDSSVAAANPRISKRFSLLKMVYEVTRLLVLVMNIFVKALSISCFKKALLLLIGHHSSLHRRLPQVDAKKSPVSVLDPPFEDDDDRHVNDDNDDDNDDEKDGFDLECSYANVQNSEINIDVIIQQVLKSSFQNPKRVPDCMKRLVSDLITEEEAEAKADSDLETVAKRVCKRIESWKDVESNTIDMMVDQDFKRLEVDGWKRNEEQIKEIGSQLEYAIFGLLMEELSEELVSLNGIS
ncbi:hypothetical protein GOBAR_AA35613 [Gossypium barbadense]|uniref:DUF4378 domain-containing protein n=1 Tax=Gossypium barbadense TaxID=3634 RepID=A0A2P5W1Z0_GOSBA|nr:hypothetical protein GOBAR_AA35613 [Gossypium barbadense]